MKYVKFLFYLLYIAGLQPVMAQLPILEERVNLVLEPQEKVPEEKNRAAVFNEKGKYGLKRNDSVLLAPVYDEIFSIATAGYRLQQASRYGTADDNGSIIIPVQFDSITTTFIINNALLVYKNGKAGLFNTSGENILPTQYQAIWYVDAAHKNTLVLKDHTPELLFETDPVKIPFQSIAFYLNLAVFKQNEKYGILREGKVLIPAMYDSIYAANQSSFKNNTPNTFFADYRMKVTTLFTKLNNKYGLVQNDGTEIMLPHNDNIQFDHYRKVFHINKDSLYGLYFEATKQKTNIEFQQVYGDGMQYMTVKKNGYWGIINYKAEQILPCEFDQVNIMGMNAGFRVKQNNKTGLYTDKGKVLIPPMYDAIDELSVAEKLRGLFKVSLNNRYGIVTISNKIIVPPVYEAVFEMNNFLVVFNGKKYGLYTRFGKQVCDTSYDHFKKSATQYSKIIFSIKDNLTGIINEEGTILYEPVFKKIGYISNTEGLLNPFSFNKFKCLYVMDSKNKFGVLEEEESKMIIPLKYDGIYQKLETSINTYFTVRKGNKFGVVNNNDSIIIPFVYDSIDMSNAIAESYNELQLVVKKGSRFGAVSLKNTIVVPIIYSSLQKLSIDNFYKAKKNNLYVLLDGNNKIINNGPFDDIGMFEGNVALSFYNHQMKMLDKSGALISDETPMDAHNGYTTFESLKQALVDALNSNNDKDLEIVAHKMAPSRHTLYLVKKNIFSGNSLGYVSPGGIREKYYNDLLQFKRNKWHTGRYNKSALTDVEDFTIVDDGLITNIRKEEHAYGDTQFMEKLLRNSIRVNGNWISTYFMTRNFYR